MPTTTAEDPRKKLLFQILNRPVSEQQVQEAVQPDALTYFVPEAAYEGPNPRPVQRAIQDLARASVDAKRAQQELLNREARAARFRLYGQAAGPELFRAITKADVDTGFDENLDRMLKKVDEQRAGQRDLAGTEITAPATAAFDIAKFRYKHMADKDAEQSKRLKNQADTINRIIAAEQRLGDRVWLENKVLQPNRRELVELRARLSGENDQRKKDAALRSYFGRVISSMNNMLSKGEGAISNLENYEGKAPKGMWDEFISHFQPNRDIGEKEKRTMSGDISIMRQRIPALNTAFDALEAELFEQGMQVPPEIDEYRDILNEMTRIIDSRGDYYNRDGFDDIEKVRALRDLMQRAREVEQRVMGAAQAMPFMPQTQETAPAQRDMSGMDPAVQQLYNGILDALGAAGFTVTSGYDRSGHVPNSLHAQGRAFDVRTRDKTPEEVDTLKSELEAYGFRVLDERTDPGHGKWTGPHLHIEIPDDMVVRAQQDYAAQLAAQGGAPAPARSAPAQAAQAPAAQAPAAQARPSIKLEDGQDYFFGDPAMNVALAFQGPLDIASLPDMLSQDLNGNKRVTTPQSGGQRQPQPPSDPYALPSPRSTPVQSAEETTRNGQPVVIITLFPDASAEEEQAVRRAAQQSPRFRGKKIIWRRGQ